MFLAILSCAQEQRDEDIFEATGVGSSLIEQRSDSGVELQFHSNLLEMIDLYEESNLESNGSLAELLNEIYHLPQEEAEFMLSNSGLVDMEQLNSLIIESEILEGQLENLYGEEYVESILQNVNSDIDNPPSEVCFWCNNCDPTGGISSPPDGSGCYLHLHCQKTRFWVTSEYFDYIPWDCP